MDIARQISAVAAVFALLGAAFWTLRRAGSLKFGWGLRPQRGGRSLQSLERLVLTPHHSLHLVRIHGREVVVAAYPQGCTVLTERAQGAQLGAVQ